MNSTKKITRATLKSFIKKNEGKLFVRELSSFDGMIDSVRGVNSEWIKNDSKVNFENENSFGIKRIWLVGGSRDSFKRFENEQLTGFEIYNCCGSWIVATNK